MKRVRRTFAYLTALICFAIPSICAPRQPFSLSIATPKEPIKAGSELRLLITLTNTSDRSISFARSSNLMPEEGFRYEIEVRDAQGHPAPPSAYVRGLKGQTTVTDSIHNLARALEPGESFVDQVTVTQFYDLTQPGKYTISITREIPPRQNLGKGSIRSNTVAVTVTQ